MSLTLSAADLRRLDVASTAILAPESDLPFDAWRLAVNSALRDVVRGETTAFVIATPRGVEAVSADQPPALLRVFEAIMNTPDDGGHGRLPINCEVGNLEEVIAGDWAAYRRDPAVNEIFLPNGIGDALTFEHHWSDPSGAKTDIRTAVYHHRPGTSRFGSVGAAMFRLLLPAMRSAVCNRLRRRSPQQPGVPELSALLDALSGGVLLADPTGRILHESVGLAQLLALDAERARLRHGLACVVQSLVSRLRRAREVEASDARRQACTGSATEIRTAVAHYDVRATYTRGSTGDAYVIATLERLTPTLPDRNWLRDRFSLTPREIEISERLSLGQTNAQIARSLGITAATARRHTEHVFSKLGVTTRAAVGARIRRGD